MELIINEVEINFAKDGEMIFVPIKPICEVLGIDHSSQVSTLRNHPILGLALVKKRSASRDNKQYEMASLPIKYFFGWLFSIDSRKVKPDASEQVLKCQEQIYDIMYEKFFLEPLQQKRKLIMLLEKENQLLSLKNDLKEVNAQIKASKERLEEIKGLDPDHFSKSLID